ncbi:MAG TPA: hypothetical protein VGF68_03200 [Solirubrobacteraceae bacterium]|jgi:hypothetical protein
MSNELDRLRRSRPSAPSPSRRAARAARAILDERIASERSAGPAPSRARRRQWLVPPRLATGAWVAVSLLVVALVAGAFLLVGSSQQRPGPTDSAAPAVVPAPGSLKAQALEVWAPAATFYDSLTPAEAMAITQASKLTGQRISACQAPYLHHLDSGTVNSDIGKTDSIYQEATKMETMEAAVGIAAPKLRVATRTWAQLTLPNPIMQRFVRGLADQINASLDAPPINACQFVRQIAAHDYSLAWTQSSRDGRVATEWWSTVLRAGKRQGDFWPWLQNGAIAREHLLTAQQQQKLTAVPGEIS